MIKELHDLTLKLRKDRDPISRIMVFHLAEVNKIGKNKENRETTEDEAIQYVKRTVQNLKEDQFSDEDDIKREIELLESLLPKMASEDEVRAFIMAEVENGLDITNKGMVMKAVRSHFGALVDMKMVSNLV